MQRTHQLKFGGTAAQALQMILQAKHMAMARLQSFEQTHSMLQARVKGRKLCVVGAKK